MPNPVAAAKPQDPVPPPTPPPSLKSAYTTRAAEALAKAEEQASTPRTAAIWLQIADRWRQLADTQP